ncbi:hypothetical protein [Microvirga sp. 2MCAF38]|uniref:hypothetical protein n=1 Tax=Microvirga sp. 2MCAF38 TaxID=3232989 RepID=UPI003F964387
MDSDRLDLKDGKVLDTGFYLNELMQQIKALRAPEDEGHRRGANPREGVAAKLLGSSAID